MAQNKKRPQYVTEIVEKVNADLKRRGVKDINKDPLANWLEDYLIKKGMYKGYNFYVTTTFYNGKTGLTLAGTYDPEKYECIQFG